MRTPMRIRSVLVGVLSAMALSAGALAFTAGSAAAATTSPAAAAPRYGCHGYGCIGKSPQQENCSSDATTVYAISAYDGRDKTRVTLRLRYSAGCQSAWATVTDTNHPDGATFWIYDRGTHALEQASTERTWFWRQWQTTDMVGVAETKAQACIEVPNSHGLTSPSAHHSLATRSHSS